LTIRSFEPDLYKETVGTAIAANNLTARGFDAVLHNGQAKAGASGLPGTGKLRPIEG
jgi:hypothetical protein